MANGFNLRAGRDMSIELRAWRATCGLTEQGAADKLGVDIGMLRQWESGYPCPYPAMVENAIGAPMGRILRAQ